MTRDEAKTLLLALKAVYQNFQFSAVLLDIWPEILKGVSYQEAQAALIEFMRSASAFAPTPGQVLEIVRDTRREKSRLESYQRQTKNVIDFQPAQSARELLSPGQTEKLDRLTARSKVGTED